MMTLVPGIFQLVEPQAHVFDDAVFALLEGLCAEARQDPCSPRYLFAFESAARVEGIRSLVNQLSVGQWRAGDAEIKLARGQVVLLGHPPADWPLVCAVVLCSRRFPEAATLRTLSDAVRVVLVIDPIEIPENAARLRQLARSASPSP
jgi:hypothetical protein